MGHNLKKAVSGDGKHVRAMGVEAAQKGTVVLSPLKLWRAKRASGKPVNLAISND
jgi:hypothetical protein